MDTLNELKLIKTNTPTRLSAVNLDFVRHFHLPRWEELPNLDLYMDQVIGFIDDVIGPLYRKIDAPMLTKSMINNYVKEKIIESPANKKYNRRTVGSAIVICVLKSAYSVEEIGDLIYLGIGLESDSDAYNHFCDAIEYALVKVFSGDISLQYTVDDLSADDQGNRYLLDNFALSFACKYYTQLTFLYPRRLANEAAAKDAKSDKEKAKNK